MATEPLDVAPTDQDAWTSHFCMVLDSIWKNYRHVLSPQEELYITAFQRLEMLTQHIYIRVFQRKGPWFKTNSLLKYFQDRSRYRGMALDEMKTAVIINEESPIVNEESPIVQSTLQQLTETNLIQALESRKNALFSKEHVELTLEAIDSCCSLSEINFIEGKVTGKKVGAKNSAGNKTKLLGNIHRNVLTQRRLDGSFLPVHTFVHQAWANSIQSKRSSGGGTPTRTTLGFRVVEHVREFFHRLHRLYYVHSMKPATSVLATGTLKKTNSVQLIVASCIPVLKHEPVQWPGLLVQFRKLQFPLNSSRIIKFKSTKSLFRSRIDYLCYEIACQLHQVMHQLEVSLIPSAVDRTLEYETSNYWKESEARPQIEIFRALHTCTKASDGIESTQVKSESDPKFFKSAWAVEQYFLTQFHDCLAKMHSFDTFILEVRSCLHSYRRALRDVASLSAHNSQLPPFFEKYNPGYQFTRILHKAIEVFEKAKQYDVAVLLLKELLDANTNFGLERKRGYWWLRLALNSEQHLKLPRQQAIEICERALSEDRINGTHHIVGGDRVALERRLDRLVAKRESNTEQNDPVKVDAVHECIQGRPLNRQMGEKSRFIGYDDQPCSVEQLVIQKFYYENWYGIHCEGHLFRNVVGMLMWEVLYLESVPDVFQTPFQDAPLDFGYADVFVRNRQVEIASRLRAISRFSQIELVSELERIWTTHFGTVSRFVSWTVYPLRLHQFIALSLGTTRLKALCEYMLSSVEYHQRSGSGIPDLLLLRLSKKHQSGTTDHFNVYEHCGMDVAVDHDTFGYAKSISETPETDVWLNQIEGMDMELRLIEVKGPRDRLSDQQRVWLCVFNEKMNISASVMHVLEEEKHIIKRGFHCLDVT
uniref:Fanconi-associated nuclease n=1 Tax=Albugo laibachii Nc14 TaxID=890382 RepID=F0WYW6_9STRA|nr:conserved hypothetical protein [Albugo laibachii Nc14]|eukprot:CCA26680.1 conserved hypothetical protein [Albugo laibachii Nc14]